MNIEWKNKIGHLSLKDQWKTLYDIKKVENHPALWSKGNAVRNAKNIIKELPEIIKKYNIKSIFDIGCGNLVWMKEIDLSNIDYTGADIVDELIEENKNNYPDKFFKTFDITKQIPDKSDLIFIRSVFIHLCFDDVFKGIENIKKSESKYLMLNSHIGIENNVDTECLMLKKRDFMKEPFNFPEPIYSYDESGNRYCNMCLWRIKDL